MLQRVAYTGLVYLRGLVVCQAPGMEPTDEQLWLMSPSFLHGQLKPLTHPIVVMQYHVTVP